MMEEHGLGDAAAIEEGAIGAAEIDEPAFELVLGVDDGVTA